MHQKTIFAASAFVTAFGSHAELSQSFDFESGGSFGPSVALRQAGGFEGLGPAGSEISGWMAYADTRDAPITVSVTDLSEHDELDIRFTLALIDSWDAERADRWYAPDFLAVRVDGVEVFRESFTNFEGEAWNPSYDRAERVAYGSFYGHSGWKDSVYDIAITGVAHTGDSATIEVLATGSGYESGGNEPFAIDALRVQAVPAPSALAALGLMAISTRRKR